MAKKRKAKAKVKKAKTKRSEEEVVDAAFGLRFLMSGRSGHTDRPMSRADRNDLPGLAGSGELQGASAGRRRKLHDRNHFTRW